MLMNHPPTPEFYITFFPSKFSRKIHDKYLVQIVQCVEKLTINISRAFALFNLQKNEQLHSEIAENSGFKPQGAHARRNMHFSNRHGQIFLNFCNKKSI